MQNFNVLIVESNPSIRAQAREAARNNSAYGNVFSTSQLDSAVERLSASTRLIDIVVISLDFGEEAIASFIEQCKLTAAGSDTAYIMLLPEIDGDSETVQLAEDFTAGVDGCILPPFATESLVNLTKVAARVKCRNAEERIMAVSELIVASMVDAIDVRALALATGEVPRPYRKEMKKVSEQFKIIAGQAMATFHEETLRQFIDIAESK